MSRFSYVFGRALRETGQALDRLGCRMEGSYIFQEKLDRSRKILPIFNKIPQLFQDSYVANNATVIGEVTLGHQASVYSGAVLRADINSIHIGDGTVIGDRAIVHVAKHNVKGVEAPTTIGARAVVGKGAILHACRLDDESHVDDGAVIYDGAVVEKHARVAAGSLVPAGKTIPSGQLWAGVPAKYVRDLTEEEKKAIPVIAQKAYELSKELPQ